MSFATVQEGGAVMEEAYKISPTDPVLSRRPFDPTKDLGIDLHSRRMNLMGREVGISVAEYTYWQIKVCAIVQPHGTCKYMLFYACRITRMGRLRGQEGRYW